MASQSEPLSSAGNSARPIVAASVFNGMADGTFDPDIYNKKAVILRLDNSASIESVRPSDKKVTVGGGKTLLQGGDKDSIWGTDIQPVLIPPRKSGN